MVTSWPAAPRYGSVAPGAWNFSVRGWFHPEDYAAPLVNPWRFFEAMLVPWILVAAPFGAVVMRLAQAAILEEIDSDYVRTAAAKALPRREVIRRHAARPG